MEISDDDGVCLAVGSPFMHSFVRSATSESSGLLIMSCSLPWCRPVFAIYSAGEGQIISTSVYSDMRLPADWPPAIVDPRIDAKLQASSFLRLSSYCTCAMHLPVGCHEIPTDEYIGLLYYDHILTLSTEVALIWQRPFNLASTYYLLIRYGFIVEVTIMMFHTLHLVKDAGPVTSLHL